MSGTPSLTPLCPGSTASNCIIAIVVTKEQTRLCCWASYWKQLHLKSNSRQQPRQDMTLDEV